MGLQGIGILKSLYKVAKDGSLAYDKPPDSGKKGSGAKDNESGKSAEPVVPNFKTVTKHDAAIALNPNDANAWHMRGFELAYSKGQYADSLESFDKAIELSPKSAGTWFWRGRALYYLGRFAEAFTSFDKACELNRGIPFLEGNFIFNEKNEWWMWRGFALYELGRYAEAITSFEKANAIHYSQPAWLWRGKALYELGRYAEALKTFGTVIANQRNVDDEVWLWHGKTLFKLGRYSEAITSYDKISTYSPLYTDAIQNREIALKK